MGCWQEEAAGFVRASWMNGSNCCSCKRVAALATACGQNGSSCCCGQKAADLAAASRLNCSSCCCCKQAAGFTAASWLNCSSCCSCQQAAGFQCYELPLVNRRVSNKLLDLFRFKILEHELFHILHIDENYNPLDQARCQNGTPGGFSLYGTVGWRWTFSTLIWGRYFWVLIAPL